MEGESQVFTTEVEFDGQTYTASYYVEHGVIHADIGGKLMATALTSVPAEKTVQALLQVHLLQGQRSQRQRIDWRNT